MNITKNHFLARTVTLALVVSSVGSLTAVSDSEAAAKPKLSKSKVSVRAGKTAKITIKNVKAKKVKKLSVTSAKKSIATVKKNGKTGFTITGKKAGKTTVTAKVKVGSKTTPLKVKVTVTAAESTDATASSAATALATVSASPVATADSSVTPSPEASAEASAEPKYIYKSDFEDDSVGDFYGRSNDGSVTVSVVDGGYESDKAMLVSGRIKDWTGPAIDLTDKISECGTYRVHFYIRNNTAQKTTKNFYLSQGLVVEDGDSETYLNDAKFSTAKSTDTWTEVSYDLTVPAKWDKFFLYIETVYGNAPTLEFVIDDFTIEEISVPGDIDDSLTSLKDAVKDYFSYWGMAVSYDQLMNTNEKGIKGFLQKHYNSITMGNSMKPDAIIQEQSETNPLKNTAEEKADPDSIYVIPDNYTEETLPVLDFSEVDKCLKKASEDGYKVRFHTLIWHEQMPKLFFKEGYESTGNDVDEATMYAREEMYIRTVMNHVLSGKYADIVYAVDVVNEYLNSYENGEPKSTNYWAPIFGEVSTDKEYVKKAFVWAYDELVKFGKTDDIALYYNDYNTYYNTDKVIALINNINAKDDLNPDGTKICAGIGMQSHFNDSGATPEKFEAAITAFENAGFDIQITELDVTNTGSVTQDTDDATKEKVYEKNAEMYRKLMEIILNHHESISSVTIWGLYDNASWRPKYAPVLFGKDLSDKKPSFDAVIEAITNYGK